MTQKPEPKTTRKHPPRARRLSSCYLHPADPATGICASCLRERLCGLDDSSCGPSEGGPSSSSATTFTPSLGNADLAGARPITCLNKPPAAAASVPELRRCRSVFTAKCEGSATSPEPRRKSCDVRPRNRKSLAHLFDVDDECVGSNGSSKVESKNIIRAAAAAAADLRGEIEVKNGGEIRDFHAALQRNGNGDEKVDDENAEELEGEAKTMKEHIDLELQSKSQKLKDFKEIAGNIREAASVFGKKLQKWRLKQKKKLGYNNHGGVDDRDKGEMNGRKGQKWGETQSEAAEYAMGRRSCDMEPRFSVDGGRISFDEPRASWDGYLIARTIPRLAPMLSVVEDAILIGGNKIDNHGVSVDGQMQSITEDESSSGGSAQSNSDSSSSQRRSSFDRSSSVRSFGKKMVVLDGDYARASPAKLVITEKELKDWHLNSMKDDHKKKFESSSTENSPTVEDRGNLGSKKPVRWRRVLNVFGFKQKSCENKCEKPMGDCSPAQAREKQETEVGGEVKDATGWKLMRSSSIVGPRRSCEVIRSSNGRMSLGDDSDCANRSREEFLQGRNQSAKYGSSNLDDGALPFYLTPLRTSRSRRLGRNKLQNLHLINGSLLQLN